MRSFSSRRRLARAGRWLVVLGLLALGALGSRRVLLGPSVNCVRPHRGPLVQRVVLTGRVITPGTSQLGVVTLGTVAEVLVDAGTHVKTGQPLVRLADAEQRATVAQARAGVVLASAQLGQVRKISGQITSANVDEARVALEQARRELARTEQLAQSGSINTQTVDTARDTVTAAASRLASAEARAAGARGPESEVAGAKIAESRAALALAEARLAQTVLLAPADGTIIERRVEPGDIVQSGKVLLVLARDGEVRLEAQADEKNLSLLQPGLKAQVVADGLPDQPFAAELRWLSPAIDVERGTVTVRFAPERSVPMLRPDMTVSINLEISRRQQALLVPLTAIRDDTSDHPWVQLVQNGRTRRTAVILGSRGSGEIEIVSGVDEKSDIVASTGLAEGARVRACGGS